MVENGTVHESGQLDVSGFHTLHIPSAAEIHPAPPGAPLTFYLEKTLSFYGHPPHPMPLEPAAAYLGLARIQEEGELKLATFGEWDSQIEGGAGLHLVLHVPPHLAVRPDPALAGPQSLAYRRRQAVPQERLQQCYWYGPDGPDEPWERLPTVPDPARTARAPACVMEWPSPDDPALQAHMAEEFERIEGFLDNLGARLDAFSQSGNPMLWMCTTMVSITPGLFSGLPDHWVVNLMLDFDECENAAGALLATLPATGPQVPRGPWSLEPAPAELGESTLQFEPRGEHHPVELLEMHLTLDERGFAHGSWRARVLASGRIARGSVQDLAVLVMGPEMAFTQFPDGDPHHPPGAKANVTWEEP